MDFLSHKKSKIFRMEEVKCEICSKKFKSLESLKQHTQMSHANEKKAKINIKKYFVLSALITALLIISFTFYVRAKVPGIYDDFAKCLTEKGAVVYGNDFCSYTNQQLNSFGKSKTYLNYIKCLDNKELCDSKNIDITPTWEINGDIIQGVQSFERLSLKSGCEI